MRRPRSPANRRAKGSLKRASGRSDSNARWKATHRAVSATSSMSRCELIVSSAPSVAISIRRAVSGNSRGPASQSLDDGMSIANGRPPSSSVASTNGSPKYWTGTRSVDEQLAGRPSLRDARNSLLVAFAVSKPSELGLGSETSCERVGSPWSLFSADLEPSLKPRRWTDVIGDACGRRTRRTESSSLSTVAVPGGFEEQRLGRAHP